MTPPARNVDAFLVFVSTDGKLREANRCALEMGRVSLDDVLEQPLDECVWFSGMPSSGERVRGGIEKAAAGVTVRRDIDLRGSDQTRQPHELTFVPERDEHGGISAVVVSGLDVSLRAKTAAERNVNFLNSLGEATRELLNPAKIMEVTARMLGQHMQVSRAAYADVEDDNDRFTIQHDYTDGCASTVGNYTLEPFGALSAGTLRNGKTLVWRDVDSEVAADSGLAAFHQIGITALICCPLIKYGKMVAMMAVHQVEPRDWTASEIALVQDVVERSWSTIERARAHLRIEQKERQFEELFEFAPDAIVMVDVLGHIALVNQRAEDLFGYTRHELIGQAIELLVPSELRDRHVQLRETYAAGTPHGPMTNSNPGLRGLRKDGSEFPAEVSLSPMETEKGPMIAASVRDNTARNKLEAQLQQSLKMETVGQLAGGVAHDFNNLLTVINATVELLMEKSGPDDPMRGDFTTILRAGEKAASLTRQLLALSRQQVLNPVIVDLNMVLKDMEPMLQRLIGEHIVVKFRPAAAAATVEVDRTEIDQVILNLALNSRDAMPNGGTLILEVSSQSLDSSRDGRETELQPGSYVTLAVSDTGAGMDEATRRKVFEPFFTTKPPGKGTGLGLSTVYGIVQQSGGGVRVDSEPGKGTTFRIFLPQVDVAQGAPPPGSETPQHGSETILVIEDEAEIRQVARIMLERRGYNVITAASGKDALQIVADQRHGIDLILSDVVMPGSSGPEIVRHIRQSHPDIRVLFMSGYAADLIARHGIEDDPRHFISKPFTLAELSRAVRETLDA